MKPGKTRLHFIGIGGSGMSGVAHMCLESGFSVSGSDLRETRTTEKLKARGAVINFPHSRTNIQDSPVVVISSAIPDTNEELNFARNLGLPIKKRAEVLAWLMKDRDGISVAGCHGKTTTTSMVSALLTAAGMDPSTVVGGEACHVGGNAKFGHGPHLVAEADESDGSFLLLPSAYSIVTNLDNDHLEYYGSMDSIIAAFQKFILQTQKKSVVCAQDPRLMQIAKANPQKIITYGFTEEADFYIRDVRMSLEGTSTFMIESEKLGSLMVRLGVSGRHNILNATAAIALCSELGVCASTLSSGLENFCGVHRRFEKVYDQNGIRIYDDYAHHPSEIKATLAAARLVIPENGKLVVCLQPHRYTRLRDLMKEFAGAFTDCDFLYVMPVYSAGEIPVPGVNSTMLYKFLELPSQKMELVEPSCSFEKIGTKILGELKSGDVLLTIGAGDITRLGRILSGEKS